MDDDGEVLFECAVREVGLIRAIPQFFCKLGSDGEAKAIATLQAKGEVDICGEVRRSCPDDWDKKKHPEVFYVFREILADGAGLPIEDILDVAGHVLNFVGIEYDYGLTAGAVAKYLAGHLEAGERAGAIILKDDKYIAFVQELVPYAVHTNPAKWMPNVFQWIDARSEVYHKRVGLALLSNLNPIVLSGYARPILERSCRIVREEGVEGVGVSAYFVCCTWSKVPNLGKEFVNLLNEILESGNLAVVSQAALFERSDIAKAPLAEIRLRLKAFSRLGVDGHKSEVIDEYVAAVAERDARLVVEYIENLIDTHGKSTSTADWYRHTFAALMRQPESFRAWLITRWLLSEADYRRRAVEKLVKTCSSEKQDVRVVVDPTQLPEDRIKRIDLVRQAMGWLMDSYSCCVSYVISCLAFLDSESLDFIEPEIFTMIVVNFTDLVESEISREDVNDSVRAFLKKEVAEIVETRKRAAEATCPELEPSADERLAFSKLMLAQHQEIMEQARANSILRFFGPEIKVLYGNGAITERVASEGKTERVEIPFKKITTQVRIPGLLGFNEMTFETSLNELRYTRVHPL